MTALTKIGESASLESYTENERHFKNLDLYKKTAGLRNYYKRWESQKEVSSSFLTQIVSHLSHLIQ